MKSLETVGKVLIYTALVIAMTVGQVVLTAGTFGIGYPVTHFGGVCAALAVFVTVRAAAKAFFNEVLGLLFPEQVKRAKDGA